MIGGSCISYNKSTRPLDFGNILSVQDIRDAQLEKTLKEVRKDLSLPRQSITWVYGISKDSGFETKLHSRVVTILAKGTLENQEHVEQGTIKLYIIRTEYQLADLFTKALLERIQKRKPK
ncbi:hypothetical protein Tco_1268185 [Tanacetum coccineum]